MFRKLYTALGLMLVLSVAMPALSLAAQQKYALVIGNGGYKKLSRLANPVNDATDMESALKELGFTIETVIDGSLVQMEEAVIRFKNRLSVSKNSYGFFFYAGHGVQSNGVNYLIPVDADIKSEAFLRERAVSVQSILGEINDAQNELNIVVLDACRDNPFGWARSGGSRGLQVVSNQPADSIIVYATAAGATAADGEGRNGVFTSQLLKNLNTPGIDVNELFRRTGGDVTQVSGGQQRPAVYNQFFGIAYLGSPPSASAPSIPIASAAPVAVAPETKRVIPVPATMSFVQGGAFAMGSGGAVIGVNSFFIGRNEVTEGEYADVIGKNPSKTRLGANYPVENVSWFDAVEYCNGLSRREGLTPAYKISGVSVECDFSANGYRLPTEAEWEFAAKGGVAAPRLYRYAGSDTLADVGWYLERNQKNSAKHPVGQKMANVLGLYDMSGNVYEWCWDLEDLSQTRRVVRGGAYCYGEANAEVNSRYGVRPNDWGAYIGFRVVRNSE